jgi:hypothetical protein
MTIGAAKERGKNNFLKVKTTEHQIGKTRCHHCFGCRLLAIRSRPEVWESDWGFLADS